MKRTQGIMQAPDKKKSGQVPDKKQSGQVIRKTVLPETNLPDGKAGLASKIAMCVDGNPPRRINGSEANPAAGNNRYQDYSRSTVVIRCSMYKERSIRNLRDPVSSMKEW